MSSNSTLYKVTRVRDFTGGILKGLQSLETWKQSRLPVIGEKFECRKPYGNTSPYIDTVISFEVVSC